MLKREEPYDLAIVDKMRREWDERARENARHYVATTRDLGTHPEFSQS